MFTTDTIKKEELELIKAFLNSDFNIPVKFADVVVSLKAKVDNELKSHDTTESTEASN